MKKFFLFMLISAASVLTANAQSKDIVGVAAGSADHSTLVAAVKAADLVGTLQSAGPFTVFAPTNAAFGKLPAGTVDGLLKPEAKATLTKVLTYHVVAGKLDAAAVIKAIQSGGGKAVLSTVSGGKLTATLDGGKVKLTDETGGTAWVTATDLKASNGVIHVIDSVVMPK
ncbi:fasciclin domain-containing protein [Flavihumibacter sp. UBA7668]|uniref:fasciclin domain-containing protein n=1 Tax=Flavihumibacter sp. UBA7668 TaxID=1946542 RepID=UPI0025BE7A14|nr:fasciclin domain-containing protein [Flavihumibacter sp. UBA7668]